MGEREYHAAATLNVQVYGGESGMPRLRVVLRPKPSESFYEATQAFSRREMALAYYSPEQQVERFILDTIAQALHNAGVTQQVVAALAATQPQKPEGEP